MKSKGSKHRYIVAASILGNSNDEYCLSENEYYKIYSFYVTYSMCGSQSAKKRKFTDYGWPVNNVKDKPLAKALASVFSLNGNADFIITDTNVSAEFKCHNLSDGRLVNVDVERAVIVKTNTKLNSYFQLFYRVRNGFAHGKFNLRLSTSNEKMVVIQDNDTNNVTARIVLKLSTILGFIDTIDINRLI